MTAGKLEITKNQKVGIMSKAKTMDLSMETAEFLGIGKYMRCYNRMEELALARNRAIAAYDDAYKAWRAASDEHFAKNK